MQRAKRGRYTNTSMPYIFFTYFVKHTIVNKNTIKLTMHATGQCRTAKTKIETKDVVSASAKKRDFKKSAVVVSLPFWVLLFLFFVVITLCTFPRVRRFSWLLLVFFYFNVLNSFTTSLITNAVTVNGQSAAAMA